jgi:hypothetical protein
MANSIDWGKIYCEMITNKGFGLDDDYTVGLSIHDGSAPVCWADSGLIPAFTVDRNTVTADSTLYKADATIIS